MKRDKLRICTFGQYKQLGARHWVIREGLAAHGLSVSECRSGRKMLLAVYLDLFRRFWSAVRGAQTVMVQYPGHYLVPLAWLLTRFPRRRLVFDVFVSLYDTSVADRGQVKAGGFHSWRLSTVDWLSCKLADVVVIDTEDHRDYFIDRYRVPESKLVVVPIGARTDAFHERPPTNRDDDAPFIVWFHGKFIPLQGVEHILDAAAQLQSAQRNVRFVLYGDGQTYESSRRYAEELKLQNTEFCGYLPMKKLAEAMAAADVCLGIFGSSDKADRVIPHKAYEVLAAAKPLITADTTAARKVFTDGEDALLCGAASGQALARSIETLIDDSSLRAAVAQRGKQLFDENYSPPAALRALYERLVPNADQNQ